MKLHKLYAILDLGVMNRVFACGPGNQRSISGRVIPKTQSGT